MLSILCFNNPQMALDVNAARRDGVRYLGEHLSAQLRDRDNNNALWPAATCVLRALQKSNGAHQKLAGTSDTYGLWIQEGDGTRVAITSVTKINGPAHKRKIYCTLATHDTLTLTIHEDDEIAKDDRKMEIVISNDRSRLDDRDLNTFYVVGTADDINALYGAASDEERREAARYTLSSITFRRCA
jgi:hypothetical protein